MHTVKVKPRAGVFDAVNSSLANNASFQLNSKTGYDSGVGVLKKNLIMMRFISDKDLYICNAADGAAGNPAAGFKWPANTMFEASGSFNMWVFNLSGASANVNRMFFWEDGTI